MNVFAVISRREGKKSDLTSRSKYKVYQVQPPLLNTIRTLKGAILVPEIFFNFVWAPIQKAHEQVQNLRRQLSSSILSFVWHRSKLGPL